LKYEQWLEDKKESRGGRGDEKSGGDFVHKRGKINPSTDGSRKQNELQKQAEANTQKEKVSEKLIGLGIRIELSEKTAAR